MSDLTQYQKIIDDFAKELKQQIVSKDFYTEITDQLVELIGLKYNYKMKRPDRQVFIELISIVSNDTNNNKQPVLKLERNATAVALHTSRHYKAENLTPDNRQALDDYARKRNVSVTGDESVMIVYVNPGQSDEYLAKIIDCIARITESILKSKNIPFDNQSSAYKVNIELLLNQ